MSIAHLDDLPVEKFINTVRNLARMQATEKLDGANLWVGIDDEGKFFTSREGKRKGQRFYSVEDYGKVSAYNQFRAAHAALEKKQDELKKIMPPGSMVEMEVIYGRQPNAISYGASNLSYIVFLRPVEGTSDAVVGQLANALNNTEITVTSPEINSQDGHRLEERNVGTTFRFVPVQKVDTAKLADLNLERHIEDLEKFMTEPAAGDITNGELVTKRITEFPKDQQEALKKKRAEVLSKIQADFKLPLKRELLDGFVSKVKSNLAADDLLADEDHGIEGVVFLDPTTGEQVKVVDKDTFTTINTFNQAMRGTISGMVRTTDPDAPLEARGGLLGDLKIRTATTLGNVDLARTQGAKKALEAVRGKDASETINNLARAMPIDDYQGLRRLVLRDISVTAKALGDVLDQFKQHKDEYRLTLKNGKVIGLSPEVVKRTLTSFAEGRRQLQELFDGVKAAKTYVQLLATLYGHHAKAIHTASDDEEVKVVEAKQQLLEQKWSIMLHPEGGDDDDADPQEILAKVMKELKKLGIVTLIDVFDDKDGGFELGLKIKHADPDIDYDDLIWNAIGEADIEWGGMVSQLDEELTEEDHQVLLERKDPTDKEIYRGKDAWTVLNIYLATLFVSFLIYQMHDKQGIRLLRDKPNFRLKRWDKGMSYLNFWGYPVWRSTKPDLKKLLGAKTSKELFTWTRRVPDQWWRFIHMDMSFGKDVPINWTDHHRTLKLLLQTSALNTSRLNKLLDGAIGFEKLPLDQKMEHTQRLYLYAQQFIPGSQLFMRLRELVANVTLNASGTGDALMERLSLLKQLEEDTPGGAEPGGQAIAGSAPSEVLPTATSTGDIAPLAVPLFRVVKRKRNPNLKVKMFPRPTGDKK